VENEIYLRKEGQEDPNDFIRAFVDIGGYTSGSRRKPRARANIGNLVISVGRWKISAPSNLAQRRSQNAESIRSMSQTNCHFNDAN